MKRKPVAGGRELDIWQRATRLDGDLPPSAARALLGLRFSDKDNDRMQTLAAKARAGTLTAREQSEIDTFERLGCLLDILHSHARQALKRRKVS